MPTSTTVKTIALVSVISSSLMGAMTGSASTWRCKTVDRTGAGFIAKARRSRFRRPRQQAINRSFKRCQNQSAYPGSCRFIQCKKQYKRRKRVRCISTNRRGQRFYRTRAHRRQAVRASLKACYNTGSQQCELLRCMKKR